MQKLLIIIISLVLGFSSLHAQNNAFIEVAQKAYDLGKFADVDSILNMGIMFKKIKTSQEKVQALRLLALSAIYDNRLDDASTYTNYLLRENAQYTEIDANTSPIFLDLLAKLKKAEPTVSTASGQAESEAEAPVPMTIITEDMISISGAQTLQDLLCLYVPGMTRIEGIEKNVSMRGVYGQMQENILIMLDGHRLNSGATNAESPDFRISLDKIKKIEILRGPASSLYGNVALSAVVNIITKCGQDLDGLEAHVIGGMHSQVGGTIMYGKGDRNSDIMAWANLYYAKGETMTLSPSIRKSIINTHDRYVNGYNEKPSFDAGLRARWKDFTVSVTAQHAKQVPFYSLIAVGGDSSYDLYESQNGNKPGTTRTSINAAVDYNYKLGDVFALNSSIYFNSERTEIYNIMGDTIDNASAETMLKFAYASATVDSSLIATRGVWESMEWQDYTIGGNVSANLNYGKQGRKNRGSILIGGQFECFMMTASSFTLGKNFNVTMSHIDSGITLGTEWVLSPFMQWKHHFGDHFVVNAGIRYDHKKRFEGEDLRAFSPRASFVWLPSKVMSVKLGYSRSFEDAPYLYRASKIKFLSGGNGLRPQYLNSIQLGTLLKWDKLNLKVEANLFYNIATDLVTYRTKKTVESIIGSYFDIGEYAPTELPFGNSTTLHQGGIELVVEYNRPHHTFANFNMTMQDVFKFSEEPALEGWEDLIGNWDEQLPDNFRANEPKLFFNITGGQCVYNSKKLGEFWVRGNMHFQSGMYYLNNDYGTLISSIVNFGETSYYFMLPTKATWQKSQFDLNLGVSWEKQWKKNRMLSVGVDVYNVTNNKKLIGTQCQGPMPNQSARVVGKVSYHF